MRDILFRGFDQMSEGWCYGFYTITIGNETNGFKDGVILHHINDKFGNGKLVFRNSVGQYTGLKDCEGNKIFVGHIVQWMGYEVKNMKQIRPIRTFEVKDDIPTLYKLYCLLDSPNDHQLKITGNTYEDDKKPKQPMFWKGSMDINTTGGKG